MKTKFTFLSILTFGCFGLKAQFDYKIGSSSVVQGVYTDLGTTGTAIATANTDDDNSAPTPIGFTFSYGGQNFTDFTLNTNGFIKLGSVPAPSGAVFGIDAFLLDGSVLLSSPAIQYAISPFNHDLNGTATTEYRVSTTGAVGSRICTIQWKDVVDKTSVLSALVQMASMNFQVKLFETSNIIEFVYGTFTASVNPTSFKTAGAGLIGADTTNANTLFIRKNSGTAWANAFFATRTTVINTTSQGLSFRNTVLPIPGITYRFAPQSQNDLQLLRIEALGSAAIPLTNPETVNIKINNAGSAPSLATSATLVVTGVNPSTSTISIPSIPVGGSLTLPIATRNVTNIGTDTLRVAISPDQVISNNLVQFIQKVTTTDIGYTTPEPASGGVGFGANQGLLACKYKVNGTCTVTEIKMAVGTNAPTVGNIIYGVVLDSGGVIIGRTSDYTVELFDLGTIVTLPLDTPAVVTTGTFFAAMAQTTDILGVGYFPLATQTEATPTRSDAYFGFNIAGGTPGAATTTLGRYMVDAVIDGSLGVKKIALDQNVNITVFPNPNNGLLDINISNAQSDKALVKLLSMDGRVLTSKSYNLQGKTTVKMNLNNFAAGIYYINVSNNSFNKTMKIVKQ
jgi:trimeric autotransporter adhesin